MKIKLLIFTAMLFCLEGCSPKQKTVLLQNPEINTNNIVDKLAQQVQHYEIEPMFLLNYKHAYCHFEVLVNDIPVYKDFYGKGGYSAIRINHAIFKSGPQKVTYRLYPVGKIEGDNRIHNTFETYSHFSMSVEVYNRNDTINIYGNILKEHGPLSVSDPKSGNKIFAAAGKTYYEDSFTFEAEVPYKLEDFENAQDLRRMDKKELEAILLKKYKEVKNIYQSKDYDNIARLSYDNLRNQFVAKYSDQKYIQEVWDMLMDAYTANNFKMQPIENYELKFFAEGKLVALMTKSRESWARGNSALWGEFDRGEGEEFVFCNRYFYILKGENDFRVY